MDLYAHSFFKLNSNHWERDLHQVLNSEKDSGVGYTQKLP